MYKPFYIVIVLVNLCANVFAQDSTKVLSEVEVQAYRYNRSPFEAPISVGIVKPADMERFDNTTILQAVNAHPGVRMEERSPGSYRFSIRGSLIRSPFGVRNIKFYWQGLPLTDGGGNTYLNLLDPAAFGNVEIIKGPGSSLYGANTGGVVLLKPRSARPLNFEVSEMIGGYGLNKFLVKGEFANGKTNGSFLYANQGSDGYREQSAFKRHAANLDLSRIITSKTVLTATLFATDIFYETPGGLTKTEYETNAKQARPAAGPNKGAVEQNANVRNKSFFGGLSIGHDWNNKWSTQGGIFGSYSDFENFAIRNVEHRYETNFGARLENQFSFGTDEAGGKLSFGGEAIQFVSPINVFQNNSGVVGSGQIRDDLASSQYLFFIQAEFFLPHKFKLTVGSSSNFLTYHFDRSYPDDESLDKTFKAITTPRLALQKKFGDHFSTFLSASKGFSPPTFAEVRPSTNTFNPDLEPEHGISYEIGVKSSFSKFSFELSAYQFNLQETIVVDSIIGGAEYFTNAGETVQKGIEFHVSWKPVSSLTFWSSYNYNHYRFKNYSKYVGDTEINYSGNMMTGVPPSLFTFGIDGDFSNGIYFNLTNAYADHIPLNDGNTEFAAEYFLLTFRGGYKIKFGTKFRAEFFAGVNNLLDEKYSLGNDLNAVNGRYYNVAAGRNFFGGVKFNFTPSK